MISYRAMHGSSGYIALLLFVETHSLVQQHIYICCIYTNRSRFASPGPDSFSKASASSSQSRPVFTCECRQNAIKMQSPADDVHSFPPPDPAAIKPPPGLNINIKPEPHITLT